MSITVNTKEIRSKIYSGGECQISIENIDIGVSTDVRANLYNSNDIVNLLMTIDAIRRLRQNTRINLKIPYFPYARQDRVCNRGEAFSLAVMADLINSLNCHSVEIYDPHSTVTTDLVKNCKIVTQAEIITSSIVALDIKKKGLSLISPDAGAKNKTREISEILGVKAIYCTKTRNLKTGSITETHIPSNVKNQDYMIVDDICDGGRTFIELAKALKNAGAKNLFLYVTHGIFSQGLDVLKTTFEHVYCYHSFLMKDEIEKDFLTCIKGGQNEN